MADWDPTLYDRFRAEREAPFQDLLSCVRVPDGGLPRVVDLGCGHGRLTTVYPFKRILMWARLP